MLIIIVQFKICHLYQKYLEKNVNQRLLKYLDSQHFCYNGQYGFREYSDTNSATTDLISYLQVNIDSAEKAALAWLEPAGLEEGIRQS